jgi:hypothetical protein
LFVKKSNAKERAGKAKGFRLPIVAGVPPPGTIWNYGLK